MQLSKTRLRVSARLISGMEEPPHDIWPVCFRHFQWKQGRNVNSPSSKFTPGKQVYFRYAERYRAGGFQGLPSPGGAQAPYRPETVKTYEIGFKGDFLDNRLRTNISAFISRYSNLQRTVIGSLPVAPFYTQIIRNAANATVKGIEFEATAVPVDNLTIQTSVTYLDSQYKNYVASFIPGLPATDNDHFPFPYSSKWTAKFSPQYVVDMGASRLTFSGTAAYASRYYVAGIPYPAARVRSLVDVSARARLELEDGKYAITLYGENLTNNHFIENFTTPPGGSALYFAGQDHKPVTYGIILGAKF